MGSKRNKKRVTYGGKEFPLVLFGVLVLPVLWLLIYGMWFPAVACFVAVWVGLRSRKVWK